MGQHQAVVRAGVQSAEADPVGALARVRRAELRLERGEVQAAETGLLHPGGGGAGGSRGDESGDELGAGGLGTDLRAAQDQVGEGDRTHPGLALAPGVAQLAGLQVAVVAGHEARVDLTGVRLQRIETLGVHLALLEPAGLDVLPVQVRVEVGIGDPGRVIDGQAGGPEVLGALAPDGDDVISQRAQVVGGEHIPLAVAEGAEVLGDDVRDAGVVAGRERDVKCSCVRGSTPAHAGLRASARRAPGERPTGSMLALAGLQAPCSASPRT